MMNKRNVGIVGVGVIALLVILVVTLPVSGAGKTGPQDGSGNQFGGPAYQNGGDHTCQQTGNGACIREDCPQNGAHPRDGTRMHSGKSGNGKWTGSQGCGHRFRT